MMKMKRPNMKKAFAILTFISLALAASLTYGLMNGRPASAKSANSPSNISAAPVAISSATTAAAQVQMPRTAIYALDTDNTLFVLWPGTTSFVRLVRIPDGQAVGNFIGIDFRPADGNNNRLYAQTDRGRLYTISLLPGTLGQATLVSTLTPQFPSGYQSLFDFNPVIDAIREIGSDTSNYAVVKDANGILNTTAVQTSLTYNPNDVNKGVTPKVAGGAYNNNFIGATATIFYAIDPNQDTLVTIDPATAGASSATGGGVLRTIGKLVTTTGAPVNTSPTTDVDIYTLRNGTNRLVGVSGRTFFTIDLATQTTPATALGTQRNVVVQGITIGDTGGKLCDLAASGTQYQSENGVQGGGNKVDTSIAGFVGTGFVNYADGVAGGITDYSVNQSGAVTLSVRYSNGSAANRPCNVLVNGVTVGTIAFPPTGSFATYGTATLALNLGATNGFKTLRIISTTAAGGPNSDFITIE
jgi:Domain of unknown function (DUF4394)